MMKLFSILSLFCVISSAQVIERGKVPAGTLEEAKKAVQDLAKEVMKGNFLYSLEVMYPRWKDTMAKRVGGDEVLRTRLESVPKEMLDKGISIIDFQVGQPVSAFEVNADHLRDSKEPPRFTEHLVFVPTTTLYRAIDPKGGVVKRLESKGFQVAIRSKKQGSKWTFIDGSNLSLSELRSLFPLLPEKEDALHLPERGVQELKL